MRPAGLSRPLYAKVKAGCTNGRRGLNAMVRRWAVVTSFAGDASCSRCDTFAADPLIRAN